MPVVVYSALRVVLLLVIWGVLVLCHVGGLLAFAIAVIVALLVSYLAFRGPRDRAALYLQERAARRGTKPARISAAVDADEAAEDAAVDAEAARDDDDPTRPTS